ncbi:hypothetical protein ONZ43_g1774 [Nemania bipapillata]|uniref:Uncharacterized protein n=1 Tax=Nemania bipapillata TaxID=110536 RepID=A0ACC2J3B9_9PEZI|nr:hypothetical protein ONZ43_g1774 [Nemania bipapillata]
MPQKKWDDKAERDLLMAMRIAENGYNAFSIETWKRAAKVMEMMGYTGTTPAMVQDHAEELPEAVPSGT